MGKGFALTAFTFLAAALLLYGLAIAFLWSRQESLLFFPQPLPANYRLATEPGVHELSIPVAGGAQLSVLQLRLADPRGVVFFLHGNAGNLAGWFTNTALYRQAGFDLVMPDYRGYGKSTGRIESEEQLREDVRAVWQAVAPRYDGRRIVLYGRSLGTALAAGLAAELSAAGRPPDLTILVSPYSSMRDLADEYYRWVPAAVLRYPLDTAQHALQIRAPVLLVHGSRDELIGLHHARRLAQALPHARLEVIEGAGHNDIQEFAAYRRLMLRELGRL